MREMQLSEEELAVISEMRGSDKAGRAIFRYAMKYDSDTRLHLDKRPFTIPPGERP